MAETLLACPWCGCLEIRVMDIETETERLWRGTCARCGATSGYHGSYADLAARWNTRHDHRKPELCKHFEKCDGQVYKNEPDHFNRKIIEACPCASWTPKGEEGK